MIPFSIRKNTLDIAIVSIVLLAILTASKNAESQRLQDITPRAKIQKQGKTPFYIPQKEDPGAIPTMGLKKNERVNVWKGDKILSLWRGDSRYKEIALTFDDGPHPQFTRRLLELLKQLDVKATFFVVGKKVDEAPAIVAQTLADGHEIANHTYHHINLDKVGQPAVEEEIRLCNEAVKRACGKTPTLFRPPGGHHHAHILSGADKLGMQVILWTDDPADFAKPGADVILSRIMKEVSSGSDILLHDGIEQTLEMLPELVMQLRHDGYRFVTLSEMIRHTESDRAIPKIKKFTQ